MGESTTTRLAIRHPDLAQTADFQNILNHITSDVDVIAVGFYPPNTLANRPAAGKGGMFYYATDNTVLYYDNGTTWISTNVVATGSVTSAMIVDGTIVDADIAADTLTARVIAPNAIGSSELADASVDNAALVTDAVTQAKMADNSVGTAELIDANVTNAKLATDAVTQIKVADNAIGTAELIADSVTNAKMADASVGTAELIAASVTAAKLATDAVALVNMQDNSVGSAEIVDGSVGTAELATDAVTNVKMANDSVGIAELIAGHGGADDYGTVFPTSGVFNGYRFTFFWNNLAWNFIRRADIDGTYPWQFIGGQPYVVDLPGGSTTSTGYVNTSNAALPPYTTYWDFDVYLNEMGGGQSNGPDAWNLFQVAGVNLYEQTSSNGQAGGAKPKTHYFLRTPFVASATMSNYIRSGAPSADPIFTNGVQVMLVPFRMAN